MQLSGVFGLYSGLSWLGKSWVTSWLVALFGYISPIGILMTLPMLKTKLFILDALWHRLNTVQYSTVYSITLCHMYECVVHALRSIAGWISMCDLGEWSAASFRKGLSISDLNLYASDSNGSGVLGATASSPALLAISPEGTVFHLKNSCNRSIKTPGESFSITVWWLASEIVRPQGLCLLPNLLLKV